MHCGILNLKKPIGETSRHVVDTVHRLVRPAKAGHAGTLDPLAAGVLLVGVGRATRLIKYLQRMPKRYTGDFLLGRQSPTEDVTGEVVELIDPPIPSHEQIVAAVAGFIGRIQQRPPAFSALKVDGQRAYDLARKGKPVNLKPRPVEIYGIDVLAYEYPKLTLDIRCGSGTYVRSLGRDLAESLGTAAVMSALVRNSVGNFHVEAAADPMTLTAENLDGLLQPPLSAMAMLPRLELTADETSRVRNGQTIAGQIPESETNETSIEVAAIDPSGNFVAVLTTREPGWLRPRSVMPPGAC
jgi:tRNA pseudouridine55 synthase